MKIKRSERKCENVSFRVYIVSSRRIGDEFYLSGLTENKKISLISKGNVKPGEIIEVSDFKKQEDVFYINVASIKDEFEEKDFVKDIKELINKNSEISKEMKDKLLFDDKVMRAMNEKICDIARKVKESIFLNKPIIVRYHNDCDGVCSAIALRKAIGKNSKFILNKFPYYRKYDMEKDLLEIKSIDYDYLNPLFIACDFGSNEECAESYEMLLSEGYEIIVIDHHPPTYLNEKIKVLNPHLFGGDSNYTTGLIASEIAYKILEKEDDLRNVAAISLSGDRSRFRKEGESDKYALVLDYLCSKKSVDEIIDIIKDKEEVTSIYAELLEQIESTKGFVIKKAKKRKINEITLVLINTDKIAREGEYPTKGDIVGILHDEILKRHEGVITIGYGKRSFNIRIDPKALSLGYDATKIINSLKSESAKLIESAGGHRAAAGIRIKEGYSKLILKSLIEKIKSKGGMA